MTDILNELWWKTIFRWLTGKRIVYQLFNAFPAPVQLQSPNSVCVFTELHLAGWAPGEQTLTASQSLLSPLALPANKLTPGVRLLARPVRLLVSPTPEPRRPQTLRCDPAGVLKLRAAAHLRQGERPSCPLLGNVTAVFWTCPRCVMVLLCRSFATFIRCTADMFRVRTGPDREDGEPREEPGGAGRAASCSPAEKFGWRRVCSALFPCCEALASG